MNVKWLEMALKMVSKHNSTVAKNLEKQIEKAKKLHDVMFSKSNNQALNTNIDRALTWENPYKVTKSNKEAVKSRKNFRKKYEHFYGNFVKNLKKDNTGEIRQVANAE